MVSHALYVAPRGSLLDRDRVADARVGVKGFTFGRISTKIILAHLTKGVFPWFSTMILPLAVGCLLVNLPFLGLYVEFFPSIDFRHVLGSADFHFRPHLFVPFLEIVYLHLALLVSLLAYSHSALQVIDRFCGFLGIRCLTIPSSSQKLTTRAGGEVRGPFGGDSKVF